MLKTFLASLLFLTALFTPITSFASYKDVAEDSPHKGGIDFFELIGAIDSAENFEPERLVSNAEFYKILFRVFGESPRNSQTNFEDVPEDAWFAPYAALAEKNGLETDSLFEPEKTLTRIEILEKLLSAYGVTGGIVLWQDRTPLFADISILHPNYTTLYRAIEAGILEPDLESKFRPFKKLSRAELADLMYTVETWHLEQEIKAQNDFYKSDIFGSIWNSITESFYLENTQVIDEEALFSAAVKGMLDSLNDPFSVYLQGEESSDFSDSLDGTFEGIGAYLEQSVDGSTIYFSGFIQDSPAESSGLKVGDTIHSIDGVEVSELTLNEIISRIKGPAGTQVEITIIRDGIQKTFQITRASVSIQFVSGEVWDKKHWRFTINRFGASTAVEFWNTSLELKESLPEPESILIDVRGNGGGYLDSANQVMGLFVPKSTPLVHLDYGEFEQKIVNGGTGPYYEIPLYILVDEYTASASEILAQSLRETDSAIIIGTQTYGKGSVQQIYTYWDGSQLKLTIAHWLSSAKTSIHGVGITPDITVDPSLQTEDFDPWLEAFEKEFN